MFRDRIILNYVIVCKKQQKDKCTYIARVHFVGNFQAGYLYGHLCSDALCQKSMIHL